MLQDSLAGEIPCVQLLVEGATLGHVSSQLDLAMLVPVGSQSILKYDILDVGASRLGPLAHDDRRVATNGADKNLNRQMATSVGNDVVYTWWQG